MIIHRVCIHTDVNPFWILVRRQSQLSFLVWSRIVTLCVHMMNKNRWKSSSTHMTVFLSLSLLMLVMMVMTVCRCCLWESIHHYIGLVVNLCFRERVYDFVASNSCLNNLFESISLTRMTVYKEKASEMQEKNSNPRERSKKRRNQNVKKKSPEYSPYDCLMEYSQRRERTSKETHTKRNDQKIKHLAAAMCWAKCDERWFVFCMRETH